MSSKNIIFSDQVAIRKFLYCICCNNALNVFPIFYNDSLGYVCGRCIPTGSALGYLGLSFVRNSLYEKLMEFIIFPCSNEEMGCEKVLKYDEVNQHEENCKYRRINCPLYCQDLCAWTGLTNWLEKHLKTHRDYFLDPPQLEISRNLRNRIFFISVGVHIVTVVIKQGTDKKYNVFIAVDGTQIESQCFIYQVDFLNIDKNISVSLKANRLYSILDFWDNLNNPETQLELNYEHIFELLQQPKRVMMEFHILKKSKDDILQIIGCNGSDLLKEKLIEKEHMLKPDDNFLIELECPVCKEYMLPPIFMCAKGHGVCKYCKTKIRLCPYCISNITNERCFILEHLISKINYPCTNRDIGCEFVGTIDNIKAHRGQCLYKFCCVLCSWKSTFYNFHTHMLTEHKENIFEQDVYHEVNFSDTFIAVFHGFNGEVFCATFRRSKLKYATGLGVSIKHIFLASEKPKFKYEIKFNSAPSNNNSLCMSNIPCMSTSYKNFRNKDTENLDFGILIPYDLLKIYTNKDTYYFKILIEKM